jgi:hypothetical protein
MRRSPTAKVSEDRLLVEEAGHRVHLVEVDVLEEEEIVEVVLTTGVWWCLWFLLSAENHRYFRNFSYIRRVR